ncbi:MAG: sigma-70 family RNA polymerase sigma factor [Clostridia bacterium]|nr:sigma-70 family RNA polymerase sigma factor [Clostridia bacterium]
MQTNSLVNEKINSLVLAVKSNDTASFLELLGHFSHTISALAHSFSLPRSELEDLCQEGRMALYRAAMSYDGKSAQFSTYAITCMTNAMISFAKKYKAQNLGKAYGVLPEDCEDEAYSARLSSAELDELLCRDGFAGLSEYERRVMSLKLAGYKVGEIAKKLEKETKSVENTLFRARQKLKKHIDG